MYTPDSSFKTHVTCLNLPCVPLFLSHTINTVMDRPGSMTTLPVFRNLKKFLRHENFNAKSPKRTKNPFQLFPMRGAIRESESGFQFWHKFSGGNFPQNHV